MKILVITPMLPQNNKDPEGKFIVSSVNALINQGHDVSVIVLRAWIPAIFNKIMPSLDRSVDPSQLLCCEKTTVFQHFSVPRNYFRLIVNKIFIYQVGRKLKNFLTNRAFDLIHVHSELSVLPVVDVAKKFSIPVVATMHGACTDKRYWKIYSQIVGLALSSINKLILVGDPLVPFYKNITIKNDHFTVVPNGFNFAPEMLIEKNHEVSEKVTFISVSNLFDSNKRIDLTLESLASLDKIKKRDWLYVVIGDGIFKTKYEQLAISLGISNKVKFVGKCSHEKVYEYLQKADVFCLPSFPEAFGIAHLEAMAFGLLSIGVKNEGPSMYIKHGETGLLVERDDTHSLCAALEMVFLERSKIKEIALRGKNHVHKNFTWELHAIKLSKVYRESVL